MPNKKLHGFVHVAIIITVLIIATVIFGAYFILANKTKNSTNLQVNSGEVSQSSGLETPNVVNAGDATSVLNSLREYLKISDPIRNSTYYRSEDRQPPSTTNVVLSGKVLWIPGQPYKFGVMTDLDKFVYTEMDKNISKYFAAQGFTAGKSSIKSNQYRIWIERSFKKSDTTCLTTINSNNEQIEIFCGTPDKNYQALIKDLTPAINNTNIQNLTLSVHYIYGNFARGEMGVVGGSGRAWIAQKTLAGWKKLYESVGELQLCSDVDKYNIPKEIDNCYLNAKTGELKYK